MTIILDIDGVMNTTPPWKKCELLEDGFMSFNENSVKNLNYLIHKTDAIIALTSSHKDSFTCAQWIAIFMRRGIHIDMINKADTKENRYAEVVDYLDGLRDDYIIIDDDKSLNDLPIDVKEKLFITNSLTGLDSEVVEKIMNYVNGK